MVNFNNQKEDKKIENVITYTIPYQIKEKENSINIYGEVLLSKALEYHSKGSIKDASKLYEECINQGTYSPQLLSNYGVICSENGNIDKAINLYNLSISLYPEYADAYSNLGIIYMNQKKLNAAKKLTIQAININDEYDIAYFNLGNILKEEGNLNEAIANHIKAISLNLMKTDKIKLKIKDLITIGDHQKYNQKLNELNESSYRLADYHCNIASSLLDLGRIKAAKAHSKEAIKLRPDFFIAYNNLGNIYNELGLMDKAKWHINKAIEIEPTFAAAYSNMASIYMDQGKLEEAEKWLLKAIEYRKDLARAYYSLSTLKTKDDCKDWQKFLFSKEIIEGKTLTEKIDLYFARSNILHKRGAYIESAKYLKMANDIKIKCIPSDYLFYIKRTKKLKNEKNNHAKSKFYKRNWDQNVFIVGMPRSGTTLIESIISMNHEVQALGEENILEESYTDCKRQSINLSNLNEFYSAKIRKEKVETKITTNKWLYNYQYCEIICQNIFNARIIYCYRNPLDNILSIYRAHFAKGNSFSSSLIDCAKMYLDQKSIMAYYKKILPNQIYYLNYESLVQNPEFEVKGLVEWLEWTWDKYYLMPHLNSRNVSTASRIQVRSPINTKSVDQWKRYKEMLQPAIKILEQNNQ
tara:strand:+ start:7343 stop:9259 length:1917 start_codon:yes stop_codon:yes gene_type:complete